MTAEERTLCDWPEPSGCYAAGKDNAYFEDVAGLGAPPYGGDCGWQSCQVQQACLRRVMTLMVQS